jgi:hypothetical protein
MRTLATNRYLAFLLCIALLFKVIVPTGFMPDMDALQHGIYKIKICTGYGAKEIFVDQNQKSTDTQQNHPDHKSEKHGSLCAFAGLHAAGLPVAILTLALLLLWRQSRYSPKTELIRSTFPSAMWARGPPLYLA